MRKKRLKNNEVVFLSPRTCGIYKDGGTRYKTDPATGKRTQEVDNELQEYVDKFLAGEVFDGSVSTSVNYVFDRKILVPRYYDTRWQADFQNLLISQGLDSISVGDLEDKGIISVTSGHGSPGNDQRQGTIPYVKVSDIRSLRVNTNPTNLVPQKIAEHLWGGKTSGLKAWDLITPNRASSNIGEFAILLPGEENIVVTKEVFVIRVLQENSDEGWDAFYLFWALCLKAVRKQWQKVALMQTNREDVADRYREILLPMPKSKEWAAETSKPFREFFTTLAKAKESFVDTIQKSGFEFIASVVSSRPEADSEDVSPDDGDGAEKDDE